jgi:pimeloyl-ACP methyl ester carboxylesterase
MRLPILLASTLVWASLLAPSAAPSIPPITHVGSGDREVWVLRPTGGLKTVIVFGHGWSTPFPRGFGAWLDHLRTRGSLVLYPRYRTDVSESTAAALTAFRRGLATAFRSIGTVRVPIVAVGKSFGGSAVFNYAAEAPDWGIPGPAALLSIFPALPIGALPRRHIPASTYVEILVGDRDTTAGSVGANAFWRWLTRHPIARKRYVIIRSRPGFIANHDSPQRTDPLARAIFWKRLDRLIARARQHSG